MKRLRLGIDLDGVCANFIGTAREYLFEMFGKAAPGRPQTAWDFADEGVTGAELDAFWRRVDREPNFWERLRPLPETYNLGPTWAQHDIYFITHRKPGLGRSVEAQSARWLREHFGIDGATVIANVHKGDVGRALGLDYAIDDKPSNVLEFYEGLGSAERSWVADALYNREEGLKQFPRAQHLNHFLEVMNGKRN